MKCPNCNQEVPDSAFVCGYCGTRLKTTPEPSSQDGLTTPKPVENDLPEATKTNQQPSETSELDRDEISEEANLPGHQETSPPGKAQQERMTGQIRCLNCGFDNEPGSSLCNRCGTKLIESEPQISVAEITKQESLKESSRSKPFRSFWLPWLMIILGWGLGGWLADLVRMALRAQFVDKSALDRNIFILGALILCFVGSLFMAFAFKVKIKETKWTEGLLLVGGWILSGVIMGLDALLLEIYFAISYWQFIGLFIGSLNTGYVLKRIESKINWKHILLIVLSWLLGSFPGLFLAGAGSAESIFHEEYGLVYQPLPYTFNLWSGLVLGTICGGLTLLILNRAQRKKAGSG